MSSGGFGLSQGQITRSGGVEITSAEQVPLYDTFRRLSKWLGLSAKMYICSGDQLFICAFPGGVLINKDEVEQYCKDADGKTGLEVDRNSVAGYVVAHEMAHLLQPGQWSCSWSQMLKDSFVRELQADFIAGVWVGANIGVGDYNFIDIANIAFGIGNPGWPSGSYPAPEQRMNAVSRGVSGAAWVAELQKTGRLDAGAPPLKEAVMVAELEIQSRKIAQEIHGL